MQVEQPEFQGWLTGSGPTQHRRSLIRIRWMVVPFKGIQGAPVESGGAIAFLPPGKLELRLA